MGATTSETMASPSTSVPKTMTAVRLYEFGGPEVLKVEQHPVPSPEANEILIHVQASSVTGWDSLYRKGQLTAPPGRTALPMPQQLGREVAGEVVSVGQDVTKRGEDNLCVRATLPAHQKFGGYAEYVVVPEDGLLHAPDNMSYEKLACLLWSYGTASNMVINRAAIRPGESVLITGASGGMGSACLQLAKLVGAYPIIALTGSPQKSNKMYEQGADVVLSYRNADIVEQIKAYTVEGMGVDVVLDNVGGNEDMTMVMNAARTGGRLALVSFLGGRKVDLDLFTVLIKQLTIIGTRGSRRQDQETVLELAKAGKIDPVVSARFPLTEIVKATELLEGSGHTGKIVVLP